jgi:6-phosphogluconolactonase
MKHRITLMLAAFAMAACENEVSAPESAVSPSLAAADDDDDDDDKRRGAVYTLTNQTTGNGVAIFNRASNGTLTYAGTTPTGGLGTGGGLGSQGAVVLSEDKRLLLAVNAGSNDVSVFAVGDGGLSLVQRIGSGGELPVSVAIRGRLVYVLNAGGSGNIAGFRVGRNGALSPITGSSRPLSAANAGAAQVSFTPDGDALIVTERFTNLIDVYQLNERGVVSAARVHPSSGQTPFGFDFGPRGELIVSEAFGGAPDASAASSYVVGRNGSLSIVTGSLGTTETSACWLIVSEDGRYAYTANTGSHTVTGYSIGRGGALKLLDADGVTGGADGGPADLAVSGRFVYVLTRGTNSVTAFKQHSDGSLESVQGAGGLPVGTVGLAAR